VVSDTGIGIPADRIAALFQRFEQADTSTTRRFGGTGLGLAICQELAERMGGDIEVQSVVGEGTQFIVHLPLPRVSDDTPGLATDGQAAPEAGQDFAAPGLRVLAAEDNAVNQLVLKTLLHQIGVEPVVVGDGAQALARWGSQEWDLILMDVQMPVMDGPTAVKEIRRAEKETGRRRTPVIALTANAMSHQVAAYLAADMDGVLSKPIEIAELYEVIASMHQPASPALN
jgi:CheY-like chemotaxis protein